MKTTDSGSSSANPLAVGATCPISRFAVSPIGDDALKSSQILIFEDEKISDSQNTLKSSLGTSGFSNVSTCNQYSVLESVLKDGAADLVLIDAEFLSDPKYQEVIAVRNEGSPVSVVAICDAGDQVQRQLASECAVEDFIVRPVEELELLARTQSALRAHIATRKLTQLSDQVQSDILIDATTGIANRRAFDFELTRKMIEWQRQRSPIALLMIDIDFFKRVNDQYGHQAGDDVLAQTAKIIEESLREMDLVCRFGGEEFVAILPIKRSNESTSTAERIRKKIESTVFKFDDIEMHLTVSIGVAEAMKGDDRQLIVKRADTALYDSKQQGRNCVTFHDGARCIAINKSMQDNENSSDYVAANSVSSWAIHDDVFNISASTILIVDDDLAAARIAHNYLDRGGFQKLLYETDSTQVVERAKATLPDLILLDIEMPEIDGLAILGLLRSDSRFQKTPIIILTSHTDCRTKNKALQLGANDVLHKPVLAGELIARVSNTLLASAHSQFLAGYTSKLEHEVKLRTAELIASRREAIQCLARAAEIGTCNSGRHIIRIGRYAAIIAKDLGFTESQVIEMEHAAQLHDVGKIDVPDTILKKQDRLTEEEFEVVKSHCNQGSRIIRDDEDFTEDLEENPNPSLLESCSSSVMRMAAIVAESHHEKWDGTGYPDGLKATNIPIEGRITAVCDVFDALSNPNNQRGAFDLERCFEMILERKGTHFDPEVVDSFFQRKAEIVQVYQDFAV